MRVGRYRFTLAVVVLLVLSACAAVPSGSKFSNVVAPAGGKGLVYVYRPNEWYGKAITFPVLMDDKKIADIGNNGFFKVLVDPGNHTFVTHTQGIDDPVTIAVKSGEIKFLRMTVKKNDPMGFVQSLSFKDTVRPLAEAELLNTSEEVARYYGPK